MKKFLTLITCFILLLVPAFSAYDRNEVLNKLREYNFEDKAAFPLFPYDGADNVNMRTENYPSRINSAGMVSNLQWTDTKALSQISNANNLGYYRDEHMIAGGGIEIDDISRNFPEEEYWHVGTTDTGVIEHWADCYRLIRADDVIADLSLTLSVDCSSDFEFVSQSDSSYRRPFELYYIAKSSGVDTIRDEPYPATRIERSIRNKKIEYDPKDYNKNGDNRRIWFDMILALPYDEYNDVGVISDNTLYPLKDSSDYTAVVTITLTANFTVRYNVYYAYNVRYTDWESSWWERYKEFEELIEYPVTMTKTISLPFFGYSSSFSTVPTDSVGSLHISTTPESQNINLNPGAISGRVKVADISYLMNDGRTHEGASAPDYRSEMAWIFLSASPEPNDSNKDGFRLINDKAGNVLTSNNNVPFIVEVQGINQSMGNTSGIGSGSIVEFDGTEHVGSFDLNNESVGKDFVHTVCEYDRALPHADPEGKQYYYHYHSFEGEVYVQLRPNSSTEPPMAGRYTGDIYVHVISGDGTEG